jgi:hypothetical protein
MACVGVAKDDFFALCVTPTLPFVLELVRSRFRVGTERFFAKFSIAGANFTKKRVLLSESEFADKVKRYALRKGEEMPTHVTTFTMAANADSGMLLAHVQRDETAIRVANVVEQFARFGPLDDLPFVTSANCVDATKQVPDGVESPLALSLRHCDVAAPGLLARVTRLVQQPSVRCVDLFGCTGMDTKTLCQIVMRDHVVLIDVGRCDETMLRHCFQRRPKECNRKLLDSSHTQSIVGSTGQPLEFESLRDPAKLRRWSSMKQLYSVSYLVGEEDDY